LKKILKYYSHFSTKIIIFENLLACYMWGPRLQPILAYRIICRDYAVIILFDLNTAICDTPGENFGYTF
jgi:hypothetical protein